MIYSWINFVCCACRWHRNLQTNRRKSWSTNFAIFRSFWILFGLQIIRFLFVLTFFIDFYTAQCFLLSLYNTEYIIIFWRLLCITLNLEQLWFQFTLTQYFLCVKAVISTNLFEIRMFSGVRKCSFCVKSCATNRNDCYCTQHNTTRGFFFFIFQLKLF